jgi:hypothetical protein
VAVKRVVLVDVASQAPTLIPLKVVVEVKALQQALALVHQAARVNLQLGYAAWMAPVIQTIRLAAKTLQKALCCWPVVDVGRIHGLRLAMLSLVLPQVLLLLLSHPKILVVQLLVWLIQEAYGV